MKKLALVLAVVGSVVGTALADEDRRDHDWNDDYWHHHHYGYWHGEQATGVITITSMNLSEPARLGAAFGPDSRTRASLLTRNMQPRFGATR